MSLWSRAIFPDAFELFFLCLLIKGMCGFTQPLRSFKFLTKIFTKAILDNTPQDFRLTYHCLLEIVSVLKNTFYSSLTLDNFTAFVSLASRIPTLGCQRRFSTFSRRRWWEAPTGRHVLLSETCFDCHNLAFVSYLLAKSLEILSLV